jgi:uncharacterized lipoprotein YddW (UPF0748 family)
MNDIHDIWNPKLVPQWKKDHPKCLMGKKGEKWWIAVNYEHPGVRDQAFLLIQEVCEQYDVDGIELDFFRAPLFFKPQTKGLPLEQRHLDIMTEFIRRVRKMTERVSEKRARPLLVAVRVPDSVKLCLRIGLDIERWLKEGLIDILIPGGYWHLVPYQEPISLGQKYGVPVYPCISPYTGTPPAYTRGSLTTEERKAIIPAWRGEAMNIWDSGGDGVYFFNVFNPEDQRLRELGAPEVLAKLDKMGCKFITLRRRVGGW